MKIYGLTSDDTVNVDDGIVPATDGGGGGCFIAAATDGSPMPLHGRALGELGSQFTMTNWKRLMAVNLSLLDPTR